MLAEQHDEWAESRRYLGLDVLSKSRADHDPTDRTGGHPSGTDRLNHQVEESHDDVVHHVPGLDHEVANPPSVMPQGGQISLPDRGLRPGGSATELLNGDRSTTTAIYRADGL